MIATIIRCVNNVQRGNQTTVLKLVDDQHYEAQRSIVYIAISCAILLSIDTKNSIEILFTGAGSGEECNRLPKFLLEKSLLRNCLPTIRRRL